MKSLVFSGIAAAAFALAVTPATASDSFAVHAKGQVSHIGSTAHFGPPEHGMQSMPPVIHAPSPGIGAGHGGFNIPGGIGAYRPAFRGFIAPRYWISPSFYIGNYSNYGLRAPTQGYRWYRYYNDAVMSDPRGYVYDSVPNVRWDNNQSSYGPGDRNYQQPAYAPSIRPDAQAYNWNDDSDLAYSAPDGSKYDYNGGWRGQYVDPNSSVYEGQWNGRVTRYDPRDPAARPRGPGAGVPYPDQADRDYPDQRESRYSVPQGYERYEECLRGRGLAGGAIGAILGGVAGNQIAGRGDRLGGSLLGAGLGGLVGVGIEKATNKCKKYRPYEEYRPQPSRYPTQQPYPYPQQGYPQQGYPQQGYPQQGGYQSGYQGGYYYYPQAAPTITTITVAPGASTTTTTTTEEITYQTVYSAPRRYQPVRKWKPKPRPRATCNCAIQGS